MNNRWISIVIWSAITGVLTSTCGFMAGYGQANGKAAETRVILEKKNELNDELIKNTETQRKDMEAQLKEYQNFTSVEYTLAIDDMEISEARLTEEQRVEIMARGNTLTPDEQKILKYFLPIGGPQKIEPNKIIAEQALAYSRATGHRYGGSIVHVIETINQLNPDKAVANKAVGWRDVLFVRVLLGRDEGR